MFSCLRGSPESGSEAETWTERWGAIRANRYQIVRVLSSSAHGKILCENPDKGAVVEMCTNAMGVVGLTVASPWSALGDIEKEITEFAHLPRTDIIRSGISSRISQIIIEKLTGKAALS